MKSVAVLYVMTPGKPTMIEGIFRDMTDVSNKIMENSEFLYIFLNIYKCKNHHLDTIITKC